MWLSPSLFCELLMDRDHFSPTTPTISTAGLCKTHLMVQMFLFLMLLLQNCKYVHSCILTILAKYALLFGVHMFLAYVNGTMLYNLFCFIFIQRYILQIYPHCFEHIRPLHLTAAQFSKVYTHHVLSIQSSNNRHSSSLTP